MTGLLSAILLVLQRDPGKVPLPRGIPAKTRFVGMMLPTLRAFGQISHSRFLFSFRAPYDHERAR